MSIRFGLKTRCDTNLMLNDVGRNPMEARGVISMELTMGSKLLATTFFVVEVQCNYSVIIGHDWIHANRCIPSTFNQSAHKMKWLLCRAEFYWPTMLNDYFRYYKGCEP
jgi:hypothetical protein